ncbi:MAG: DUF222 domain-containing protein [Steroidobacteraceae bacterium]
MEGLVSSVSTPDLIDQITHLAGHLNAANAQFLSLIAEFDRRQGWAEWGVKSCAHWLNWKCGIDLGAAREKLRAALSLEQLPNISAAMAAGKLSYAKVRAMTRIADQSNEAYLLNIALHGTASQVEKLVRSYRRAKESQELTREAAQQRNQSLWWFHEPDGSLTIKGRLPAEVGALFFKALQAAEDSIPRPDVSAETSLDPFHTTGARRVEALSRIAESFLASGPQELSGGDRQQIVVHVDVQSLKHDHAGRCELEHGPSLAAETARRLSCDASLIAIIESEQGEPLNVGRKTRTIPPAIRRALNSRDRGCRFPGCGFTRYVDGHHVKHWVHGGETKLSNLVTLCRFHHRQVHEGRVVVQILDDGAFRFIRPNGDAFDSLLPCTTHWTELVALNQAARIAITPVTAITGWTGEELDIEPSVNWLLQNAASQKRFRGNVAGRSGPGDPILDL